MNKAEIQTFIEIMEEFGDDWTVEQVENIYGDRTLEEAVRDRKSLHSQMAGIIDCVINR